jgi:hypothetical protein
MESEEPVLCVVCGSFPCQSRLLYVSRQLCDVVVVMCLLRLSLIHTGSTHHIHAAVVPSFTLLVG